MVRVEIGERIGCSAAPHYGEGVTDFDELVLCLPAPCRNCLRSDIKVGDRPLNGEGCARRNGPNQLDEVENECVIHHRGVIPWSLTALTSDS